MGLFRNSLTCPSQGVSCSGWLRCLPQYPLLVCPHSKETNSNFYNLKKPFSFCHLPEITEEALTEEIKSKGIKDDVGPFWRQYRCIFGFIAQMSYVWVSAAHPILFVWMVLLIGTQWSSSHCGLVRREPAYGARVGHFSIEGVNNVFVMPSNLYCWPICWRDTLAMDRSSTHAHNPRSHVCVGVYACCYTSRLGGSRILICAILFRVNLLPSKCCRNVGKCALLTWIGFQCIFTLGTKNLGVYTKRGSGLIVMVRSDYHWQTRSVF